MSPVLELVSAGLGASLQDQGRLRWKRFGVPPGGAMDDHAARWANILLGNPLNAPVLELPLHGAIVRALAPIDIALTGAAPAIDDDTRWRTWSLEPGDEVQIQPSPAGVWTYLAARGGFSAPRWFGSVSIFPRGGIGTPLGDGSLLSTSAELDPAWPQGVGYRWVNPVEQRDYAAAPALRVWPGPQRDLFPPEARSAFFSQKWRVSARSDRTGYRLEGVAIDVPPLSLPSEPVLPGSIQIPPDGCPIVTMRDGPTVGGYPKIGVIDPRDLSWMTQIRPSAFVRFQPIDPSAA